MTKMTSAQSQRLRFAGGVDRLIKRCSVWVLVDSCRSIQILRARVIWIWGNHAIPLEESLDSNVSVLAGRTTKSDKSERLDIEIVRVVRSPFRPESDSLVITLSTQVQAT